MGSLFIRNYLAVMGPYRMLGGLAMVTISEAVGLRASGRHIGILFPKSDEPNYLTQEPTSTYLTILTPLLYSTLVLKACTHSTPQSSCYSISRFLVFYTTLLYAFLYPFLLLDSLLYYSSITCHLCLTLLYLLFTVRVVFWKNIYIGSFSTKLPFAMFNSLFCSRLCSFVQFLTHFL